MRGFYVDIGLYIYFQSILQLFIPMSNGKDHES